MKKKIEIIKLLRKLSQSKNTALSMTNGLIELNKKLGNPQTEIREVAGIISKDPMLTASILKVANSSYYGLAKQVSNVKQAVSVMGFSNVQKFFTAKVMKHAFKFKSAELWDNLWKHSLATAVASEVLSKKLKLKAEEIMFTAGILHDLGSFIIYSYLPKETDEILERVRNDENHRLVLAEKEVIGISHQEVGGFFAKEWNFPEIMLDCIKQHHLITESKYKQYIGIVMLANQISKALELGKSENQLVSPLPNWVWGMLHIKDSDFPDIVKNVHEHYNHIIELY